jgi:hypothetical protein
MEAGSRILALLTIYCPPLGYGMKRIVRLRRGLYVEIDSYRRALRLSLPFFFCLAAVLTAGITLQYIEQQQLLCTPTQRAQ